ncbi:MAG TPA: histidine phosphatase family protein [Candidatus Paceibacterota bacterium]|nr:histidine phosphatase family protein [Candidatus Paceibacterota bacterium]
MNKIDRPIQFIVIRHAESARNKAKKGSTYFADDEARKTVKGVPDHDIPLTDFGREQAEQTGRYLRERFGVPDFVYHSGYVRTIDTKDGILKAFTPEERAEIQVRMNVHIRERDPGYAYDMTTEEAERSFPWLKEYWKTFGGFMARPPGGESLCDVALRARGFYEMIKQRRVGQKVWAVTHGGTIRSLRFEIENWPIERALAWPPGQSPKNCGITVYDFNKKSGRLELTEYNTVAWQSQAAA